MQKSLVSSLLFGCLLMAAPVSAQAPAAKAPPAVPSAAAQQPAAPAAKAPETPRPSPSAKVSQRVGFTDISVEYSSPGVKKRKVWGDVVPLDKMWRTGANASTKVTFSKDVVIGDKPVPAGTYALLTIPGKKSWTLVLNKNTDIGGNMDKYVEADDVARVTATPKSIPSRERLTFLFSDTTDDSTSLDLEWDKVRVSLPIKAPTK
jgi:hypothetical protein